MNDLIVHEWAPVAAVALVAVLSALPTYMILRRTKRGRARGAIAYIAGFFAGLAATAVLAGLAGSLVAAEQTSAALAGLVTSFIGPVAGMVHARLRRAPRRRSRTTDFARNYSR